MEQIDFQKKLGTLKESKINLRYEIAKELSKLTKLPMGMILKQTKGWSDKSLRDLFSKCKSNDEPTIAYWAYRKSITWE